MSETKKTAWEKKCELAADTVGTTVFFPEGNARSEKSSCFEDDGALHVQVKGKPWACFHIGQDTPGAEANEMTRKIMTSLGLQKKITERVLVEEDDDDEDSDTCPCCGREK